MASAAHFAFAETVPALASAAGRIGSNDVRAPLDRYERRQQAITKYAEAYRQPDKGNAAVKLRSGENSRPTHSELPGQCRVKDRFCTEYSAT